MFTEDSLALLINPALSLQRGVCRLSSPSRKGSLGGSETGLGKAQGRADRDWGGGGARPGRWRVGGRTPLHRGWSDLFRGLASRPGNTEAARSRWRDEPGADRRARSGWLLADFPEHGGCRSRTTSSSASGGEPPGVSRQRSEQLQTQPESDGRARGPDRGAGRGASSVHPMPPSHALQNGSF